MLASGLCRCDKFATFQKLNLYVGDRTFENKPLGTSLAFQAGYEFTKTVKTSPDGLAAFLFFVSNDQLSCLPHRAPGEERRKEEADEYLMRYGFAFSPLLLNAVFRPARDPDCPRLAGTPIHSLPYVSMAGIYKSESRVVSSLLVEQRCAI